VTKVVSVFCVRFRAPLNLDFEIKEIDEIYPPELKAEQITNYLAC
jgi:septum formation protein